MIAALACGLLRLAVSLFLVADAIFICLMLDLLRRLLRRAVRG